MELRSGFSPTGSSVSSGGNDDATAFGVQLDLAAEAGEFEERFRNADTLGVPMGTMRALTELERGIVDTMYLRKLSTRRPVAF